MDTNLSNLWEIVEDRGAWYAAVYGAAKSQVRLSNWTTTATQFTIVMESFYIFQLVFRTQFFFFTISSAYNVNEYNWIQINKT